MFDDEGASGLLGEVLNVATVRQIAAAFGSLLMERCGQQQPAIILAGDGRPATAELVAAASDGVRLSGCTIVETPSATAASAMFAQRELGTDGVLLVGNAEGEARAASLRFWEAASRPISEDCSHDSLSLDALIERFEQGPPGPPRHYGGWRRAAAEAAYLATFSDRFHALRPLQFMLDTSCAPLARYLKQLLRNVGCRAVTPNEAAALPENALHFGVWIDGDGERLQLQDECGRTVPSGTVLLLLAHALKEETPELRVIVEEETPDEAVERLEQLGAEVFLSARSRHRMHQAMVNRRAVLGGGPSGRFWFASTICLPDALQAASHLLKMLSQSDRPLSEVTAVLTEQRERPIERGYFEVITSRTR
jgi:phosphomannomutase